MYIESALFLLMRLQRVQAAVRFLFQPLLCTAISLFGVMAYCAETVDLTPKAFASQINEDADLVILIKENKRCIRCHQKKRLITGIEAVTSFGAHASAEFYNNCTACHGNKGEHPKRTDAIISFDMQSKMSVFTQNKQCITCHSPEDLRRIEWTHDVHATKLLCSTCHSLHRDSDAIIGIDNKIRIGLCRTCHEAIQRTLRQRLNN
ncbi:cytochrome C [Photobacterium kagoshimensis]|uniref:cytochrome C n=1 Tax=Photobacterium kagoshimensis TaxID=2910242 RepID=UPI003D0FBAD0